MIDAINIATSGLRASQHVMETISANIANSNTRAYKSLSAQLQTLQLAPAITAHTRSAAFADMNFGAVGVQSTVPQMSMAAGSLQLTGNSMDVAINGSGFFQMKTGSGDTVYSRTGAFQVDANGNLVDGAGNQLDTDIKIDPSVTQLTILSDGTVESTPKGAAPVVLGQITLAYFKNPAALNVVGPGLYSETKQSGPADSVSPGQNGAGTLSQGYAEASNVQLVDQFTAMVITQRAYEASANLIQVADGLANTLNGLLRG